MNASSTREEYQSELRLLADLVHRVHVSQQGRRLSFIDVLRAWSDGAALCDFFTGLIAESPFQAMFWEMPPLTRERLGSEYECVLIDSPALARRAADPAPFDEHFDRKEDVVVFANLGADATLVAPSPGADDAGYPHLAAFCRSAPAGLSRRFWQRIGEAALRQISDAPIWISTAGLGVDWLHARLDSRPKYYSHDEYRCWPQPTGNADA